MWYITNWPNMASCLWMNETAQEFQLWLRLNEHITVAVWRIIWKDTSLTGQQLSCTPHKNSAGALYSYRSVNPAKYCLQIRAFITLAGEGGDKTLLHKSTPPIQFAFHLLLCCNKLCLCCGFFQFSECFFPFFCNSSYRHNCGLLQPLSPKVSCLLS